jgi:hypothetical protein
MSTTATKPLGGKCYGHIGHLPGSRMGPGDHKLNDGQARILTERARDAKDRIIVTEKLDGSNVGVARVDGILIPLIRAGYPAISSTYGQHRLFADWVFRHLGQFEFIPEGHRVCGEWLAQAHGTRYELSHEPFVVFDIMNRDTRWMFDDVLNACREHGLTMPTLLSDGPPCGLSRAIELLGRYGHHGALDPVEGAVWRVERKGKVDFLGKYVRPGKQDGCYLPGHGSDCEVWNWHPPKES